MSNSNDCDNSCPVPESISAPYVSHNIEDKRYLWQPVSIPYTQHFKGKVNARPPGELPPPSGFPGNGKQRPLNVVYCKAPATVSAPYVAHILKPCPIFHQPVSIPFTQHYYHRKEKDRGYKTALPPPSGFPNYMGVQKYSLSCKCKEPDSAPYVAHILKPPQMFHLPQSIPYSQHFFICPDKKKPGELPPPYVEYWNDPHKVRCETHNNNIYCQESTATPYAAHEINDKKVITYGPISGPYGQHNLYPLPTYTHSFAQPATFVQGGYNYKKFKCPVPQYCQMPLSIPYIQHVLKLIPKTPPVYGLPYAQHASQEFVKRIPGGGGPPALAGVNTMFVTNVNKSSYNADPCNPCYDAKACYNLSTTYGPHGVYPCTGTGTQPLLCCPKPKPFGIIQNKLCPKKPKNKQLVLKDSSTVYGKPDVPFGVIQNLNLCKGEKIPTPFGIITDSVGLGVQKQLLCRNPCPCPYTRGLLANQPIGTPFSVVANNKHRLYWVPSC